MTTRRRSQQWQARAPGAGGGSGTVVVGSAEVPWGPDFGGNAGSDGITITTADALDLERLRLAGTIGTAAALDLERLRLTGTLTSAAALDLERLRLAGTIGTAAAVDLERLRLVGGVGTAAAVDLDRLRMAGTLSTGPSLAGSVIAPPFVQAVTTSATVNGGSTSPPTTKPSGTLEGHLLVAVSARAAPLVGSAAITSPAGWTRVVTQNRTGTTLTMQIIVDWKIATGAEPADYTWSGAGSAATVLVRLIGTHPANPVPESTSDSASEINPTPGSISLVAGRRRVFTAFMQADPLDPTYTPPTGHVEDAELNGDNVSTGSHEIDVGVSDRVFEGSGSTGGFTWAKSGGTPAVGVDTVTVTFSIRSDVLVL